MTTSIVTLILFLLFGLILILGLGCQIYVANILYREQGLGRVIIGFLRPNATFSYTFDSV